ncbi:hypothetical protein H6F96_16765 [Microcoleus sp. FACHB-53]|nr:hypothetical protein [Microcoleus sp. FACHB-53]
MSEELKVDPKQAVGQDAELAAQNMADGIEKTPDIDVDADYEASKEYSVSDIDRNETGTEAAGANIPNEFRQMAKDVNPSANA